MSADILIYNSLERKKVPFVPTVAGKVGFYLCGPTVYSDAHLGHAKANVAFDVVRRAFLYFGYDVRFVSNITDVGHLLDDADDGEDKLQVRAKLERLEPMEIADKYFWSFMDDMKALNVMRPTINPRATGHIPEQIALIEELIKKGFAYEVNGSVYFDVRSYPEYGKLSNRKLDDQAEGTREEVRSEKRDPRDFALWKRADPAHLMRWSSPWGVGFPGWHIECSAMSLKYLGESFDIHAGGMDLQFPHHEAEIAQSEAAGHSFARYWMHNNMLTINGEKMSKSKGNYTTIKEILSKYDAMIVRFLLIKSHYRSITEMSDSEFAEAKQGYKRLLNTLELMERNLSNAKDGANPVFDEKIKKHQIDFENALRDDFNTPKAVAALFGMSTEINSEKDLPKQSLIQAFDIYKKLGFEVLGLFQQTDNIQSDEDISDNLMTLLLEARQNYRLNKQFQESDKLRDALKEIGIVIEDTKEGTYWRKEK